MCIASGSGLEISINRWFDVVGRAGGGGAESTFLEGDCELRCSNVRLQTIISERVSMASYLTLSQSFAVVVASSSSHHLCLLPFPAVFRYIC